jgi:hypothetical protein
MSDSATIVIVGAFLMTAVALSIRRGARPSRTDTPEAISSALRREIVWEGTYSQAFQRVLNVLHALGASITAADPNRGTIEARVAPSPLAAAPFGVHVKVVLTTKGGSTSIELSASPVIAPFGNRGAARLLADLVEAWERLPSPESAPQT